MSQQFNRQNYFVIKSNGVLLIETLSKTPLGAVHAKVGGMARKGYESNEVVFERLAKERGWSIVCVCLTLTEYQTVTL